MCVTIVPPGLGVGPVHLLDLDTSEDGEVTRHQEPSGQGGVSVTLKLQLQPPPGDELGPDHARHLGGELGHQLLLRDARLEGRDSLDAELPVIDALSDGQRMAGSDVEVVELLDGQLGLLRVPVADVAVGSVGSTELDHQPQLEDLSAGGEYGHQLVLEAVPGDSVAVDLGALGGLGSGVVRVAVDLLTVLLVDDEASLFKELLVVLRNLLLI